MDKMNKPYPTIDTQHMALLYLLCQLCLALQVHNYDDKCFLIL